MEGRYRRRNRGGGEERTSPVSGPWRERTGIDEGGWRRGKGRVVSDELGTER